MEKDDYLIVSREDPTDVVGHYGVRNTMCYKLGATAMLPRLDNACMAICKLDQCDHADVAFGG